MAGSERLDEVKELVVKLATITGRIDQRNREALQRVEGGVRLLDTATQRLQDGANQFAQAVMQSVGRQVQTVVAECSVQALDRFNEQLQVSVGHVKWATEAMTEQRKLLSATQRALVWKGLIALLIGSVLAAAAGGYLFWQARQLGGESAFDANVRQALQSGASASCNGYELCARTIPARRGGNRAQSNYVIVR